MPRALGILFCLLLAAPGHALQLELPRNARQTAARDSALEQVSVPIAPFAEGSLRTELIEGPVQRRAYQINAAGLTPLQILAPLRAQIDAAGYQVLLDCNHITCGGFDFRFAVDVLPAPNMYVNIRAFHYLSARNATTGDAVTLLASAADSTAYLQIIQVGEGSISQTGPEPAPVPNDPQIVEVDATGFAANLLETGSAVLNSLDFAVGTTTLAEGPSTELEALADLLNARPNLLVAVVGHTDTIGGLEANINVSRARARAVRARLIESYGVSGAQVQAEGMGYLSPVASNLTEPGREANRRVEVIVVREDE